MIRRGVRRGKAALPCALALAALAAGVPRPAHAQGGPPLITDDPDTPGPGYWEVNLFGFLERSRQRRVWEEPRVDHDESSSPAAAQLLYNLGARYKATQRLTLMLAGGHTFRGPAEERPRLLFLAGIQLNLPGTFRFGAAAGG